MFASKARAYLCGAYFSNQALSDSTQGWKVDKWDIYFFSLAILLEIARPKINKFQKRPKFCPKQNSNL
jgi:hypothetical protein